MSSNNCVLPSRAVDLRPLNDDEVKQHLKDFGLTGEFVRGKVERLSAGQKSRLVLAAAMWNRPHFVIFDEPTNVCVVLLGDAWLLTNGREGRASVSYTRHFSKRGLPRAFVPQYLDREALEGLSAAIQKFRGGVMIVSHNEKFVEDLCEEFWLVESGVVRPRDGGDDSDAE